MSTERQRATVRQLMPQLKDELARLVAMPSVWPTESVEARA